MEEKWVTISDQTGRSKIKYFFTDPEMLTSPTEKMIQNAGNMESFEISFTLDNDTLNKVKRAASALGHTSMKVESKDTDGVVLMVFDTENPTSNTFSIDVPGQGQGEGQYVINISNLKIVPGDYDVKISNKNISNFTHKEKPIQYWIALEK